MNRIRFLEMAQLRPRPWDGPATGGAYAPSMSHPSLMMWVG